MNRHQKINELDGLINRILQNKTLDEIIPKTISCEQVMDEFKKLLTEKEKNTKQVENPYLINVAGIPGAGKTTLAKKIYSEQPYLLYISFDEIMESISYYKSDMEKLGAEEAFNNWELPARYLGYTLLKYAIEHNYPILFEHSNSIDDHIELYRTIRKMGYKVEIRFIDIDIDTALERAKQRVRFVPESMIRDRYNLLKELNEQYKNAVDEFIFVI